MLAYTMTLPQLIEAERVLGKRSLARFIQFAWEYVEPGELLWNWHLDATCDALTAVSAGHIKRLLINMPPGCMKSLCVSTFWPAWDWISNPGRRFLTTTYAQNLSNKNAKLHRDLVMHPWYQDRWRHVAISSNETKKIEEFATTRRGSRRSTAVTAGVTGFHGDIIIWDDLIRAQDAQGKSAITGGAIDAANGYLETTLQTRGTDPKRLAIVGIMQRLHSNDPAQRCIDSGEYVVLNMPMEFQPEQKCQIQLTEFQFEDPRTEPDELLWPERFDEPTLQRLRTRLGPQHYAAQYNQNPTRHSGSLFTRDMFQRYDTVPECTIRVITVDATFKKTKTSDFVSIDVWGAREGNFYLLDNTTERLDVLGTQDEIRRLTEQWQPIAVHVEDKANGPAIIDILNDDAQFRVSVLPWSPGRSDKIERAESVKPLYQRGVVWFPSDSLAPWMEARIKQHTDFPLGQHDDMVDSGTMALIILHDPTLEMQKRAYAAGW